MKRLSAAELRGGGQPADTTHFTGAVHQQTVHAQTAPQTVRTLLVSFEDGARTHWHSHAGGQVLHVLEGEGLTQSRGGEPTPLRAGDVVVAEPGEQHWHGAAPGQSMRHLAISLGETRWEGPADHVPAR